MVHDLAGLAYAIAYRNGMGCRPSPFLASLGIQAQKEMIKRKDSTNQVCMVLVIPGLFQGRIRRKSSAAWSRGYIELPNYESVKLILTHIAYGFPIHYAMYVAFTYK